MIVQSEPNNESKEYFPDFMLDDDPIPRLYCSVFVEDDSGKSSENRFEACFWDRDSKRQVQLTIYGGAFSTSHKHLRHLHQDAIVWLKHGPEVRDFLLFRSRAMSNPMRIPYRAYFSKGTGERVIEFARALDLYTKGEQVWALPVSVVSEFLPERLAAYRKNMRNRKEMTDDSAK